jgi:hypothetical protein
MYNQTLKPLLLSIFSPTEVYFYSSSNTLLFKVRMSTLFPTTVNYLQFSYKYFILSLYQERLFYFPSKALVCQSIAFSR